ncbi:MAG: hypothetical protein OXJ54_15715 [Gemmatimonadetes bacterium]|nr:hypothetical protein [Candidatus Palauibacter rhopaloidicola]
MKHRVKVVMADSGGRLGTGWDYLNTCNSSFVERDRYTYNTEEVTCPECLGVLEREAREELRRIWARRKAGVAGARVKHMAEPVPDSSFPDFVNKCNPDFGSDYTFGLETVTCPECLDTLEQEAREELRQLHVARERLRQIEIATDSAAATPKTVGERLRTMLEAARTWWADRRGLPSRSAGALGGPPGDRLGSQESQGSAMRMCFRFADVFPPEDAVSQFLVGLCMAINDVTLSIKLQGALLEQGTEGESNYSLYLMCAYYREAAKFLDDWLEKEPVSAFLGDLSPEDHRRLDRLRKSFTPWSGSFVEKSVKPVRDVVFHYTTISSSTLRTRLERASDHRVDIEMGSGTYQESRYGFADEILATYIHEAWGASESQLKAIVERVADLALDLVYFAHAAVDLRLGQVDPSLLEPAEASG